MRLINKQHFLNALLRENKLHPVYDTLKYSFSNKEFIKGSEFKKHKHEKSLFYYNYCVPRSLKAELGDYKKISFKLPSLVYRSYGVIIDENLESAEDYLNSHFSKKQRYSIRKGRTLLEQCFDLENKVFFGKIERDEFDFIMNKASEFLRARFKQKNEENEHLVQWETYCNYLYPLINKRKASIFVIYNGASPIQITINFNINKICFGTMLIYDIDYSKYSMGHIGVYNLLDWCIKNKYDFLDLGRNTYEYKTKWSNYNYESEGQIIFNHKQKILYLLGYTIKALLKAKHVVTTLKYRWYFKKVEWAKKRAPILE